MKRQTIYILLLCVLLLGVTLLLAAGIVPLSSRAAAPLDEPYVFLQSWGNEIGVFRGPEGIAVSGDRVYVCDTHGDRIQVFDLCGIPLATFGGAGSGDGRFD